MSTVTPSKPTPPPSFGTTQNVATAIVVKGAGQLANVSIGQLIEATVTAKNGAKQVQVQTSFGPMTLQSVMALPKGAVLTLVLSTLTPPSFMIGLIDGQPIPGGLTAAQAKAQGLNLLQGPQPLLESQILQTGTKIDAVLLRPAQVATSPTPTASTATPVSASPRQQGAPTPSALTTTPTAQPQGSASAPSTSAQPTPTSSSGAQATSTTTATTVTTTTAAALPKASNVSATPAKGANTAPLSILPSGTRFSVTIQSITPPSAALSTPSLATSKGIAQGQVVTGTVIGRTPQGQPIVQTPNATISLDSKAVLIDGTKITLKFDSAPLPAAPSLAAQRLGRAGLGLGLVNAKTWDDFNAALKTLAASDPQRLQHIVQTALPQPGPRMGNQMLFFLNALKGGDIKSLFGDSASRILEKERPNLLSKLGGDFQVMSKMADEPQSGDWRLALIPLWNGEKLDQIRFYHRGGGGVDDENDGEEGTRFVLDVDLSNLGHLQLDGFMKATKKRLDLIIRTEQALPEDMRKDISIIGQTAQDLLGLSAFISFQANPNDFVEFPPNTIQAPGLLA